MLPKKNKVKSAVFTELFKKSRSYHSPHLTLRVIIGSNKESFFSFVVPKSVSNKAVDRNLFKRRGYYVVSKNFDRIKRGFTCVFFVKKEAKNLDFNDFSVEILSLLNSAGVINK